MQKKIISLMLQKTLLEKEKITELINENNNKVKEIDSSIINLKKEILKLLDIVDDKLIKYYLSYPIHIINESESYLVYEKEYNQNIMYIGDQNYEEYIMKYKNNIYSIVTMDGIYIYFHNNNQ
jgi:hypothetical protein